jgi:hypothetical protein
MERSNTSDADLTQDLADGEIVDGRGRPYFLWDVDMTLKEFRLRLRDPDPEVRAYLVGKLLRQARPADVARFVTEEEVRAIWPLAERYAGRAREFWRERLGLGGAPRA